MKFGADTGRMDDESLLMSRAMQKMPEEALDNAALAASQHELMSDAAVDKFSKKHMPLGGSSEEEDLSGDIVNHRKHCKIIENNRKQLKIVKNI